MNIEKIRADFPLLKKTGVIYLDNAATSLKPQCVLDKMTEYYTEYGANIHRGAHKLSVRASQEYERAHSIAAKFFGTKESEIIMAFNTTHALNLVSYGLDWKAGNNIVSSCIEHHSNLLPWMYAAKKHGLEHKIVESDLEGNFDIEKWQEKIDRKTQLVSVTAASNVLGCIPPVKEIGKIAHDAGALFMIDCAAAAGHIPLNFKKIGADFAAVAGHKAFGPTGTGILYAAEDLVKKEVIMPAYLGGGTVSDASCHDYSLAHSPDRFEAGTPNIAGVLGLGVALEYISKIGVDNIRKHDIEMMDHTFKRFNEIPSLEYYGPRIPEKKVGLVTFNIAGMDAHDVALLLDETANVATRSGHHCAYPLMKFLGVDGNVRASYHAYNTTEEVDVMCDALEKIAQTVK